MADSKLSALSDIGTLQDADVIYVVRDGVSYKASVSAIRGIVPYIDGEVANYSSLPVTVGTPPVDSAYLVRAAEGLWLINRKPAGIYVRTANAGALTDWTYAGTLPDVFSDANFRVYDDGDTSREMAFSLGGITAGNVRTVTIPDKSGTMAMTSDIAEKWRATFDGQGSVIETAIKAYLPVVATGTIASAALVADVAGSITITAKRYTPSGGALGSATTLGTIALSSAVHVRDTTLSGWTKSVTAGDVLELSTGGTIATLTRLTAMLATA